MSIQEYCGDFFWRFRIGIGYPPRYELLPQYVTNPWTIKEKQLLHINVFDSILYHLLNSTLACTDLIPYTKESEYKDPELKFYKNELMPIEGYWPGSMNDPIKDRYPF